MHELAVCQGLMSQVERIAADNQASAVERIVLQVGLLSGVEPPLLQRAFEVARAGTVAANAELEIKTGPVRLRCRECNEESEARPNRLLCAACGDWRVQVLEGEEMLLVSLELSGRSALARDSKISQKRSRASALLQVN
jgi:hydrogenase nickel incorporation protein HypA/HybF